jgi:hypothetical protein
MTADKTAAVKPWREVVEPLLSMAEQMSRGFPVHAEPWYAVRDTARALLESPDLPADAPAEAGDLTAYLTAAMAIYRARSTRYMDYDVDEWLMRCLPIARELRDKMLAPSVCGKNRYAVRDGWHGAGLYCTVLAIVHKEQGWAVVVWDSFDPDGDTPDDPDLFKLAGLEPFPAGVKCQACADTGDVVVGYDSQAQAQVKLGPCPNCALLAPSYTRNCAKCGDAVMSAESHAEVFCPNCAGGKS